MRLKALYGLIAASIISVFPLTVLAILPVDIEGDPERGWGGQLDVSLSGKSGNTHKEDFSAGALVRHRRGDRVWLIIGDYGYGESDRRKNEDNMTLHSRWIERDAIRPNWDLEAYVQWEYDDLKDISDRRLVGGGSRLRRSVKDFGRGALHGWAGAGLFYEEEVMQSTAGSDQGFRINLYGKLVWDRHQAGYPIKLYGLFYLQPLLDKINDARAIATTGLEVNIFEHVTLASEFAVEYDSDPFPGVKQTDYEYGLKVTCRFK